MAVIRHATEAFIHFGDRIRVRSGGSVCDLIEAHAAVRGVLLRLQHLAGFVLQLKAEFAGVQRAAVQLLAHRKACRSRLSCIGVHKLLAAVLIGNLCLQHALMIVRHRHSRRHSAIVIRHATETVIHFGDRIRVRSGGFVLDLIEGYIASRIVLLRLHHFTGRVLQLEAEFADVQRAALQRLAHRNAGKNRSWRIRIGQRRQRSIHHNVRQAVIRRRIDFPPGIDDWIAVSVNHLKRTIRSRPVIVFEQHNGHT